MHSPTVFQWFVLAMFVLGAFATGYVILSYVLAGKHRVVSRLRELANDARPQAAEQPARDIHRPWALLQKLGSLFLNTDPARLDDLRTRLLHAGYSHPQAPSFFVGFRLITVSLFAVAAGLGAWLIFRTTALRVGTWVMAGGAVGYLVPSFLLASQVRRRQGRLQCGLPDALDVLVMCLEGGLGFQAAMQWVTDELGAAHPQLGDELHIAFHEMQMGLSPGEAFKQLADRTGLDSARDLAALLLQSDKLGVGLAKTLRAYSESARRERRLKAQESAQKAAVKILFPTMLFIFPAIFIVLMGPAAFQLAKLFSR